MLTREVAESFAADFRRWLDEGDDPLFIKLRIWDPAGFDLVTFEAAQHDGAHYMRLHVVERETGRAGFVETQMGPIDDTSVSAGSESIRAETIIENMANLGPGLVVWDA